MNSEVERERQAIEATIGDMTLVGLLRRNAERFADHPAIQWKVGEEIRTLTWSEYHGQVEEVAAGLRTLGVEAGTFVAIMGGNRPEHVIADLGIVHAGAVPVSLYNTLAGEQIQYIAGHCSARVAVLENADYL
ncbi:MAG: AMP-binding protein, partial [bacterium]|nr:AMP-binding protein [bacterium]